MNVYKIRDLLSETIVNKTKLLEEFDKKLQEKGLEHGAVIAYATSSAFLQMNIAELSNILDHVNEVCKEETDRSWANDDRQMGDC